MAKKKASTPARKAAQKASKAKTRMTTTPQPDPREDWGRKPIALQLRGSPSWKGWVERLAKHCQMSVSALVSFALLQIARQQAFDEKPPER